MYKSYKIGFLNPSLPQATGKELLIYKQFIVLAFFNVWRLISGVVKDYLKISLVVMVLVLLLGFLMELTPTVGQLDTAVWQLLVFSLICYLLLLFTSLELFRWLITSIAFPTIHNMVLQFKHLTLWQQFVSYWASFALLFLGALLCLAAIF